MTTIYSCVPTVPDATRHCPGSSMTIGNVLNSISKEPRTQLGLQPSGDHFPAEKAGHSQLTYQLTVVLDVFNELGVARVTTFMQAAWINNP